LYAKVVLSEVATAKEEKLSINLLFVAAIGFFLLLFCIFFMVIAYRRRNVRVFIKYEGNSRDFCMENEDVEDVMHGVELNMEKSMPNNTNKKPENYDIESVQ
jgi:hypothetical protein